MKPIIRIIITIFIGLLLCSVVLAKQDIWSPNSIVQLALGRIQTEAKLKKQITYKETVVEDEYDGLGKLLSHKPTSSFKRPGVFRASGVEIDLTSALLFRYQLTLDRDSPHTSLPHDYLVNFLPREDLIFRNTADEFINRLQGTITVTNKGYLIKKFHGEVKEPFDFVVHKFLIFRATIHVHSFEVTLDQEEFNGISIEKRIHALAIYDAIFIGERKREYTFTYSDFVIK